MVNLRATPWIIGPILFKRTQFWSVISCGFGAGVPGTRCSGWFWVFTLLHGFAFRVDS